MASQAPERLGLHQLRALKMHSKKRGSPAVSDLGVNSVLHTGQGLLTLREADIGPFTFTGKYHLLRSSLENMRVLSL